MVWEVHHEKVLHCLMMHFMSTLGYICSHFDAVTAVAFHPTEAMLLTGSEDKTLKLWNLQRNGQTRK